MARRGISIADLNPKFLPQVMAQLGMPSPVSTAAVAAGEKRVKQKAHKRSALEDRWATQLAMRHPRVQIHEQFPLRIGNNCNYYVDFLFALGTRGALEVHAHEVKGPYSRFAGIVKLKAAASLYPWIRFQLVSFKDGRWIEEEIFP